MAPQFEGNTADEIWSMAASQLLCGDGYLRQNSRLGMTRELLHCMFHLRDPRQRWVLSRRPAMNPAFGIAEVVWILQGRNDSAFLNFWNRKLPEFAGYNDIYYGAYGYRLRENLGLDQITRAFEVLAVNPDSRQVVMQIWDSRLDMPTSEGISRNPDIPCNICSMPKVRNNKLEWFQVMRSNDLYLGTPHNFVQFTTLQEVIAGWLGIELGSYVQVSDSIHLYEHDMGKFDVDNAPKVVNSDKLSLSKSDFDRTFPIVGNVMDELRDYRLTPVKFNQLLDRSILSSAWSNLIYVAAADAARRRGWREEVEIAASRCNNLALRMAWDRWVERWN